MIPSRSRNSSFPIADPTTEPVGEVSRQIGRALRKLRLFAPLSPCARRCVNREEGTMNILLWVLQVIAALLYGSSGIMKVFMFDKVSQDVPSFGALPRKAWMTLGIIELVCTVGLIVPVAFHWRPALTILAATVLAVESLVFVGVHVKYREVAPMILSCVLGLLMAFIAYGRMVLQPIF